MIQQDSTAGMSNCTLKWSILESPGRADLAPPVAATQEEEAVERIVNKIVQALDEGASLTEDQREIAEYSLYNVLISGSTILGLAAVSWLLGIIPASFAALATGAAFRWSMGGAHYSDPWRCVVASVVGPTLMALLASRVGQLQAPTAGRALAIVVLLTLVFAGVSIWRYSPADTKNNPISDVRKPRLRSLSFITLGLWLALAFFLLAAGNVTLVAASSMALARQSLTVTPIGYRLFSTIERVSGFSITARKEAKR